MVVIEVHNTHGERHLYTLRRDGEDPDATDLAASMDKDFYVSPFIEMVGRYTVRVRDEPSRLRITINEDQDDALLLHTSLDLTRHRADRPERRPDAASGTRSSRTRRSA